MQGLLGTPTTLWIPLIIQKGLLTPPREQPFVWFSLAETVLLVYFLHEIASLEEGVDLFDSILDLVHLVL